LGVGRTLVREKDDMEMVYVPGGIFEMGSADGDDHEQPVHTVTLDSFWIDKTEVTNAEYARCVVDGTCSPPSESGSGTRESYYGDSQFDNYPVIYVSWYDADTYCQWVGGRLPTEAEWEYAARGPDGNVYPWGNDPPNDTLLNYDHNVGDTTEVGAYPDGASWVGAMDMAGNVWEWVADWYDGDYYASSPSQNPKGPETRDEKVARGGGWSVSGAGGRAASRYHPLPDDRLDALGFRCVVEPGN
jgi:serine/threonine-protein kinase